MVPTLAVDALAAYRLTRLVTEDVLTDAAREWVIVRAYGAHRVNGMSAHASRLASRLERDETLPLDDPKWWQEMVKADYRPPHLATLVTCRWCAGMWVSLGVIGARAVVPRLWDPLARALACSGAAALIAGLED